MNGSVFNSLLNQFNQGFNKPMNMGVSSNTARKSFIT